MSTTTTCDLLLTNAHVLTMDEAFTVHPSGSVAIAGGTILAVGDALGARVSAPAETIDCRGRVVMPGLVNAHTHAPMTLLRGLADDLRLDVWLMGYMMPVERAFVQPGLRRARHQPRLRRDDPLGHDLLRRHVLLRGVGRGSGRRGRPARAVRADGAEVPGARRRELRGLAGARARVHHALEGPSADRPRPSRRTRPTPAPTEILRACAELASEFDVPLHTHLAETAFEVEQSRKRARHAGDSVGEEAAPVRRARARRALRPRRRRRNARAEGRPRRRRAQSDQQPEARLRHRAGREDARARRQRRHRHRRPARRTTTSTCSRRCGWRRCSRKASSGDPTALPARQALAMATRIGARAVHLGDITGSLEPGKRADLIVVDLDQHPQHAALQRDPNAVYSQIVYAAKVHRRRRRDVRRPVADARPPAADARRRRRCTRPRAMWRAASTRS